MHNTKDVIYKSIRSEYDSIQNIYLAITKEMEAYVKLDFFPLQKTTEINLAYIESIVEILQQVLAKQTFHIKKKQMLQVIVMKHFDYGQDKQIDTNNVSIAILVDNENSNRLVRLCLLLIERALRDRMKSQRNNGQVVYYFEYLIVQFLENIHGIVEMSYRNCFAGPDHRISIPEYDSVSAQVIKVVRCLEEYPFHRFQDKQQSKKILLQIKNRYREIRDQKQRIKKPIDSQQAPPAPWFSR